MAILILIILSMILILSTILIFITLETQKYVAAEMWSKAAKIAELIWIDTIPSQNDLCWQFSLIKKFKLSRLQ